MSTITSANSVFVLSARLAGLFPAGPFQVQGYSSDDAFATEAVVVAEVRKGVDGIKSAGYIPRLIVQTVTLQADSPSINMFDAILGAMDTLREVIDLDGVLTLQSVGRSYALVNGTMTRATPIAPAKKVLEPVTYEITWDVVQPVPVAP